MTRSEVSIVIRCFNEERHIGRLLYGITEQTVRHPEIIIVDSGSTDDTLRIARQFPVKTVLIAPEEFTFGRALNRGCEQAGGEFLVLASAHVYPVYEDWLERLLEPFGNGAVGAVYGKQRGSEQTKYSERQIFAQLYPDEDIPVQETPFCNNANCAVRRSLWKEVRYNEQLTGLEDLEWARRIMARGYRVSYAADAEIVHVHDETLEQVKHRYMREAIALKEIYPDQRMSFVDFIVLLCKNTLTDYGHAAKDGEVLRNLFSIPCFRLMQFWGAYRGFQQHGPVPHRLRRRFYYPREIAEAGGGARTRTEGRRINYRIITPP